MAIQTQSSTRAGRLDLAEAMALPGEPTLGPWEWHTVGKDWVLWGAWGNRPIILDVGSRTGRPPRSLRVRDSHGIMVPFLSAHPDAGMIAAAPDHALLAAALCRQVARIEPMNAECVEVCVSGMRHVARLDFYGVASLSSVLRTELVLALGKREVAP
jgi:hypothetical protein